ncbi:MAG TPA: transcription elongation factor GreA, partial [Gaiellaceae bacterium]|nr:transcription elongation factor GreA [Gaiellaceae bacterium]
MTNQAITRAGLARLATELERLRTEGRAEIAERIRHAASVEANAVESSDYQHAREEQAALESRIAVLEERLAEAVIVDPDAGNGVADVGERVRVRDLDNGRSHEYELVGTLESDAFAGRISILSPVGGALLGCRPGDTVSVETPRGRLRLEVLAVEPVAA